MTTQGAQPSMFEDPALIERLHDLRKTDNVTNWYYLVRTWVYLLAVMGLAGWFLWSRADWGLSWWWNVPVVIIAGALMGAGQHQLVGLVHEGAHHTLFRHRKLNEHVSNLFCAFPVSSTTYFYRVQHHAHHQFVNDDERDPDVWQQKVSGHWLDRPMKRGELFLTFLRWLIPLKLFRYAIMRARTAVSGAGRSPYRDDSRKMSKRPKHTFFGAAIVLVAVLASSAWHGNVGLLAGSAAAVWIVTLVLFRRMGDDEFVTSRLRPVVSHRLSWMLRVTHFQGVLFSLALASLLTGKWVWAWAFFLWVLPLFTAFSLFMALRQVVQHANNDRGRLTNTHTFLVNPFVRWAIFPIGQDYHLPHHLFASVPHYRLKDLHRELMKYPEYGDPKTEVEVEGYLFPRRPPPRPPTVVEALGPGHTRSTDEIYTDDTVTAPDL